MVPFFLYISDQKLENEQSFCPFKMLTGFPCPGCGITKSLVFFYQGEWTKSMHYHLFGPLVVLFCVLVIVVLVIELITKKEYFNRYIYNQKLAYQLAFVLAIYHIVRLFLFIKNNSIDDIIKQSIWG